MALEAVVYQQDLFGYTGKEFYSNGLVGGNWGCDLGVEKLLEKDEGSSTSFEILDNLTQRSNSHYGNWDSPPPPPTATITTTLGPSIIDHLHSHHQYLNSSSQEAEYMTNTNTTTTDGLSPEEDALPPPPQNRPSITALARPKRRRVRCRKNKEDIENQRMTHIAVERNRRKQMNEYLSVLRSLMPDSYVQRGDQASIIGGAINFVKELEQRLQFFGTQKEQSNDGTAIADSLPFSEFFAFPQYSTAAAIQSGSSVAPTNGVDNMIRSAGIADVEVTMVESHASIKIRTRRRPKQLLRMVSEMQTLKLTILHLNVTTVDQIVLYSLSVKVEDECRLSSVDEIATAVHQLLSRIQEEAILNI